LKYHGTQFETHNVGSTTTRHVVAKPTGKVRVSHPSRCSASFKKARDLETFYEKTRAQVEEPELPEERAFQNRLNKLGQTASDPRDSDTDAGQTDDGQTEITDVDQTDDGQTETSEEE
jgi:hypothetical protein